MKKSIFVVLVCLLNIVSCGSESGGVVNNAGTGSGTLKIDATISAKENFSGAKNIEDFTTDIVIKVWDIQGTQVTDASITVTAGARDIIIPHDKNGVYKAVSIVGYDRVYSINIVRGSDSVNGVTITGPEIHTLKIGNPADTPTTIKASSPVSVLWSPYGYATSAEIETRNFKETVADSGTYTIPEGNFEVGVDDYIRITREKSLNPAGAIGGSIATVKIRNRLDPIKVVE
jgi:hypothetical protein